MASAKKPQRPYWHGWQSSGMLCSGAVFIAIVEEAMKDGMAYAIMVEIIGLRFSIGLGTWTKENDGACVMLFHSADSGNWSQPQPFHFTIAECC